MKKILTLLAFAVWVTSVVAIESKPYKFEYITTENGLSQSTIESIFQDSKGYLWIGSQLGASRIDIRNFTFDDSKCKIEIKGIKNGKKYLELEKNKVVHLPTDNRNVIIRFSPDRNKFLLKNVFFDYALINEIGDTLVSEIYDQEGLLEMNYLAPGEYTLEITARKYGVFMDHIEIEIHAPYAFLENPGVRFLGIILTVGILLLFVYSRSRLQKRVLKRDLELVQLQQQNDNLHLLNKYLYLYIFELNQLYSHL